MSSRAPCKFGAACRFNAQGTCNFSHAAAAAVGPCKFGAACRFYAQGTCRNSHEPVQFVRFNHELESMHDEILAFYTTNRLQIWRDIIRAMLCVYSVLPQPEEEVAMAFEFLAKLHQDHILVHWASDVLANPTGWFREISGNDVVPEHCIRLSVWLAGLVYHYPVLEATLSKEEAMTRMRQIQDSLSAQIDDDCSVEDARDEEAGFHAPSEEVF
jgi:hypothetical protein